MKRLTTDNPQENFEVMANYVFSKDGWAYLRHDGEKENVPLTDWAKAQCLKRGCENLLGETAQEIDETLCDCLMDGEGCPVALAYCFGCQAIHMRTRLKAIEDILGEDYDLDKLRELTQAEKAGRLVVPPCKVGDKVWWVHNGKITRCRVYRIQLNRRGLMIALKSKVSHGAFPVDQIGKTIFLSQLEAEEAIA